MSLGKKVAIGLGAMIPASRWKVWLYRRVGYRIGRHVRIRRGSYIHARKVSLADGVTIEPHVKIVCDTLIMGEEAKIDSETIVYGAGRLEMAYGAYIGPRAWINCEAAIYLGVHTGIGPGSSVYTHGVWLPYFHGYPRKFEPVTLEDGVWVPGNVTIMPGVSIGKGSMIGSGSLVTKDIPPESFAAGSPAKIVSSMDEVRRELSPEEMMERVREALDGFLEHLKRQGAQVAWSQGEFYAGGRKRGLRGGSFLITIHNSPVDAAAAQRIAGLGAGSEVLLVAPHGVRDEALLVLRGAHHVHWFDIPAKRCRRAWTGFAHELRRYLAAHYGTRFALMH